MNEGLSVSSPIFLIIILLSFVALIIGLVMARIRKENQRQMSTSEKNLFYNTLFSGISISLLGGFLMFDGDILGEATAGIARIMGFIGLALIVAASAVAAVSGKNNDHR